MGWHLKDSGADSTDSSLITKYAKSASAKSGEPGRRGHDHRELRGRLAEGRAAAGRRARRLPPGWLLGRRNRAWAEGRGRLQARQSASRTWSGPRSTFTTPGRPRGSALAPAAGHRGPPGRVCIRPAGENEPAGVAAIVADLDDLLGAGLGKIVPTPGGSLPSVRGAIPILLRVILYRLAPRPARGAKPPAPVPEGLSARRAGPPRGALLDPGSRPAVARSPSEAGSPVDSAGIGGYLAGDARAGPPPAVAKFKWATDRGPQPCRVPGRSAPCRIATWWSTSPPSRVAIAG